jgi:hypothetical protein
MTELLRDLLPWFCAFYVADGLAQVRRGQVLFEESWLAGFRAIGVGLRLNTLRPAAQVFRAWDLPLVPGSERLYLRNGTADYAPAFLQGGDLDAIDWPGPEGIVADDTKVKIAGRAAATAPSVSHARALVGALRDLAAAEPAARAAGIRRLAREQLDATAVRKLRRRIAPLLAGLKIASTWVAIVWFLLFPAAVFLVPTADRLQEGALLLAVAAHVLVLALSAAALLRAGLGNRVAGVLLPMALFPPSGARALSHVLRELHGAQDALALLAVLLPAKARLPLLRSRLHRANLERVAFAETDAAAWFEARAEACERFVRAAELRNRGEAHIADQGGASLCPLCYSAYRAGFSRCSDCGVPLEPTTPPSSTRGSFRAEDDLR